jgi:hypothetical protein
MGIEPDKETVKHIWYADWLGLGVFSPERIKIMGVPINTVRQNYELPPTLDRDIKRY